MGRLIYQCCFKVRINLLGGEVKWLKKIKRRRNIWLCQRVIYPGFFYFINHEERYAIPAYRIENLGYEVELPPRTEWLVYGWKNNQWQKIKAEITHKKGKLPAGYSMYVLIPNPTPQEEEEEKFNQEHGDIYKIMAV